MRKTIGTIIGIGFAIVLIDTFWDFANSWFPAPIASDADAAELLARFVMAMPLAGQLTLAAGWFVTGFVSAYAGLRVAQWRPAGWVAGAVVVAVALWDLSQLAQPVWLQIASIVLPAAGTWFAERIFHRARPGDPLIN